MRGEYADTMYNQIEQLYGNVSELQKKEHRVTFFTKNYLTILRKLGKEKVLVICKPDKGRGPVILNRENYVAKVKEVLNKDKQLQKVNTEDPLKHTLLLEDRLNRKLKVWQNKGCITEAEYKELYASGTRPGILYGQPKIHKNNIPVRPVLTAIKTPAYKFSRFLIQFIEKYTHNEYTLKNSVQLIDELKDIQLHNESFMFSYDIQSLYINIPVDETMQIILSQFPDDGVERNLKKKDLEEMLKHAKDNSYFIFNEEYYKQNEVLAMGQPLSPPLANAF